MNETDGATFQAVPPKTSNATTALKESAEFNHKAVLALDAYGRPRAAIAELLGLSVRTVRRYLKTACNAYEIERAEAQERREVEQRNRTANGDVRFWREDDYLTEKAIYVRDLRAAISRLWATDMSVTGIARELGVSRQVTAYHLKAVA